MVYYGVVYKEVCQSAFFFSTKHAFFGVYDGAVVLR